MSNILSFLFKIRNEQNVFAVKSSETDLLKSQHVRKKTNLIKSHCVMLDVFLNATLKEVITVPIQHLPDTRI